jgi:hypothetical protein
MAKDIWQEVTGKSVAIVGNAQSIFDKQNGVEIDSHDIVIRFNKGFIVNPESQGTKTDIVLLACELTDEEKARYKARYYVNRSKRYKSGDYTLPRGIRGKLRDEIGAYPTTGYLAICMAIRYHAKQIDLYGFDFEETPTFYNPQGYVTQHNYSKEKEIITSLKEVSIN